MIEMEFHRPKLKWIEWKRGVLKVNNFFTERMPFIK